MFNYNEKNINISAILITIILFVMLDVFLINSINYSLNQKFNSSQIYSKKVSSYYAISKK